MKHIRRTRLIQGPFDGRRGRPRRRFPRHPAIWVRSFGPILVSYPDYDDVSPRRLNVHYQRYIYVGPGIYRFDPRGESL